MARQASGIRDQESEKPEPAPEQLPQTGGRFIRQADGSLLPAEPGGDTPSPTQTEE